MAKAGTVGRLAAAAYTNGRPRRARPRRAHLPRPRARGISSPAKTRVFLGVERALAHLTDRLVAISPEIRTELLDEQRIGRPDQYRVIPLGFELGGFSSIDDRARLAARETLGIPAGSHVASTVGRLTGIKDHRLFIETARLIADVDPDALFLIVGDGELRQALEQAARDGGIAGRTRFLGWRRDLDTVYGATDVFLLTSRNEGTPVALIEALAAGRAGREHRRGRRPRRHRRRRQRSAGAVRRRSRPRLSRRCRCCCEPRQDGASMGECRRVAIATAYQIDRLRPTWQALYGNCAP